MEKADNNFFKGIKISFGFLFGLVLFPSNVKSVIIFITGLLILVNCFKSGFVFNKKYFILSSAYFLILLITFFFSENISFASRKIQTMSSLVVFPLMFSMLSYKEKKHLFDLSKNYLLIYIISVFFFNIIPFLWFYITNYNFSDLLHHFKNVIIHDMGKYGIHPIYMSMHCCLAIFFSVELFSKMEKIKTKLLLLIINFILLFFLIVYAKIGPIIAFIFTIIIWLYLKHKKEIKKNFLIVISLILLFIIIPTTRERFLEIINVEKASVENHTSSNIRYTIYSNSLKLINESPFLGYGIGDYNDELRKTYINNASFLLNKNYNSHNQYISFVLIGGVGLLIAFLFFYFKKFRKSVQNKNTLLILLLIFYGIIMLFENILERESGVIFFAFFLNFFAIKNYNRSEF